MAMIGKERTGKVIDKLGKRITTERITFDEFLKRYEGQNVEWVNGKVVEKPMVSVEHSEITTFLIQIIGIFVMEKKLGSIYADPFLTKLSYKGTGRAPDLQFIHASRRLSPLDNYLDGAPDLAVEVVSPGSRRRDTVTKFREYEKAGVAEYWIIDPKTKTADFYVREINKWAKVEPEQGRYTSREIEGLWIEIKWLWTRPGVMSVLKAWGLG